MARRKAPPSKPGEPSNAWVGKTCAAWQRMEDRTKLLRTLMGGTPAMVKAGEEYLPREEGEERGAYDIRLKRSVCHGFVRATVDHLSARPFAEPVTIRVGKDVGELPRELAPIETDADNSDSSLTQFGRRLCVDGLVEGIVHVLVDFPAGAQGQTRKQQLFQGRPVHPYFVPVYRRDLIGWTSKRVNGRDVLMQIRIRECHSVVVDGEEKDVEHVRVINAPGVGPLPVTSGAPSALQANVGTWEVYRKDTDSDGYTLVESGTHTFGAIPLVTVYFNRSGFMEAEPPLADLGELEKAHWQSASDQTNILRYARVPKLAMAGVGEDAMAKPSSIGVQSVWKLKDPTAKVWWVEPQGTAIAQGRQHILDLQAEMNVRALQPLMERTGDETATGQEIADKKSTSNLKAWVRALEAGFKQALEIAAQLVNVKLPEKLAVDIFSDWAPPSLAFEEVRLLKEIRGMGDLSRATFLSQLKGRLLPEDLDVEDEIDAIEDEGPSLAELGMGGPDDPDAEDEDDEAPEPGKKGPPPKKAA